MLITARSSQDGLVRKQLRPRARNCFCFFWMRRERLECDFSGNATPRTIFPSTFLLCLSCRQCNAGHRRAGQVPRKLLLNATDTTVHKELLQLPEGSFQGKPQQVESMSSTMRAAAFDRAPNRSTGRTSRPARRGLALLQAIASRSGPSGLAKPRSRAALPPTRRNTDCGSMPTSAWRPFLPVRVSASMSPACAVKPSASSRTCRAPRVPRRPARPTGSSYFLGPSTLLSTIFRASVKASAGVASVAVAANLSPSSS
jgi:hypothetical protein